MKTVQMIGSRNSDKLIQDYLNKGGNVTKCKTVYGSNRKPKSRNPIMITSTNVGRHIIND